LQPQLEFSLSSIDEQKTPRINEEISIIYVPTLAKKIKQHMSSGEVYENHHFIDELAFTDEQVGFLTNYKFLFRSFLILWIFTQSYIFQRFLMIQLLV